MHSTPTRPRSHLRKLVIVALLLSCLSSAHAEWTWNTASGTLYTEANWDPTPPANSINPATPISEDLLITTGTANLNASRLFLGTNRLRVTGGSVSAASTGISADGNASDIKCGLLIEGGSVDVGYLEDVICGLSGDAELILRYADPLRDTFVELASPDCSIRFVGMSQASARSIVNLQCSLYGLQAVENKNYRLVTSGSDTILEPYIWLWTGAGDGQSLYQGANWDTDPDTAGTQAGASFSSNKRLPATLLIESGNVGGGGFSGIMNLYQFNIYMTGGHLKSQSGGGIKGGINARNERNPMHMTGGTLTVDTLTSLELHLGGTAKAVLRDADEALDNVVVVLSGTAASIEFTQADYLQIVEYYLPMIDTDAGPALAGVNVCISPLSGGGFRLKRISDLDSDGMDDTWETDWTGSTAVTGTEETDGDSLDLLGEFLAGTRPDQADTDGDGLNDGAETGSDPLKYDTDGDGLSDAAETTTNPALADTDGDGFKDGGELRRGTDPLNGSDRPDAPNVILVLVDDAGWGELGSYGNTAVQTPALDTMAAAGQRFTDAYANGCVCAPTRYSLMVGRHTGRAELRSWNVRMRTGDTSLATMMSNAGYQTGIFGKWAIGDAGNGGLPSQNGFDHFFGIVDHQEGHRHYQRYLWRNNHRTFYNPFTAQEHGASSVDLPGAGNHGTMSGDLETNRGNAHSHDLITKELFEWINSHKDDTFFACWHPINPHGPAQESAHPSDLVDSDGILADTSQQSMIDYHYTGASLTDDQKTRASQMSSIDYDIGRLMTLLSDLAIDDNTIIIFTSDNGADQTWAQDTALKMVGDLRGYKFNLYEGGMRVPFIVWGQGVATGVSAEPISLDDIMPTIAEIGAGTTDAVTSGRSILSLINGTTATLPTRPLYWEWSGSGNWSRAVRLGKWKLHRFRSTSTPVTTTYELYNLVTDPNETTEVSAANPDVVDQLERIMDDTFYHDVGFENFRATDEFHTIDGDAKVALGTIGAILDAGMTTWTPLAYDLTTAARFEVRFILDAAESGAFELTDDSGVSFVGFTANSSTNQLTLTCGAQTTSDTFPPTDADGAWTAWVNWIPGSDCSVTVGGVTLQLPAPGGVTTITRARQRALSGAVEFSSFRLYDLGAPRSDTVGVTTNQAGTVYRVTRPTLPGESWHYQRSDDLSSDNWTPAEVLRENRQLSYGSQETVEAVFPFQEAGESAAPEQRFYRSIRTTDSY